MNTLTGKTILVTGGARRIGREISLAIARIGGNVIIHHNNSQTEAESTAQEITAMGNKATIIQADFSNPSLAIKIFQDKILSKSTLYGLVNSAAIFQPENFKDTSLVSWSRHLDINLTMPFLLSQFIASINSASKILNILDWRAFRPGYDHFSYTISKSALASLTKSTALALAPAIQVNGIALGAILPPSDGEEDGSIVDRVPAKRWSTIKELTDTVLFFLTGPEYITGEIIHLDGGRHLI